MNSILSPKVINPGAVRRPKVNQTMSPHPPQPTGSLADLMAAVHGRDPRIAKAQAMQPKTKSKPKKKGKAARPGPPVLPKAPPPAPAKAPSDADGDE